MKNFKYETERNKLIPKAEKYADEMVGDSYVGRKDREHWSGLWNSCYHNKMDSLWAGKVMKDAEYDFGS